jgi:fructokinase
VLLVVGESLVDELPAPQGTRRVPGGSPANVARGLARLGHPVVLRTCLGDDEAGRLVRESLTQDGVDVDTGPPDAGGRAAGATSRAVAVLDEHGRASYDLYVTWDPGPIVIPPAARWVHTGSLATVLAPGDREVARALEQAAQRGLPVSVDLNSRAPLPGPPAQVLGALKQLTSHATVVKASDDDLALLAPTRPWRTVARSLLRRGRTRLVVVTLGERGAWAGTDGDLGDVEVVVPAPAVRLVDTVGAGDAFMAALIDGLVHAGGPPAARDPAVRELLTSLLSRACVAAAMCCERPGADPPTRRQLDERLAPRPDTARFP